MCVHVCPCVCVRERKKKIHTRRMIKANKVNVNICRIWVKDLQ